MEFDILKYAAPAVAPGANAFGIAVRNDGKAVVIGGQTAPYIQSYAIDRTAKTLAKLTDPTTVGGNVTQVTMTPAGDVAYVGRSVSGGTPRIYVYSVASNGALTLEAVPSGVNGTANFATRAEVSDDTLFAMLGVLPVRYSISGAALTRMTDIAVGERAPGNVVGAGFQLSEDWAVSTHATSPFFTLWKKTGTELVKQVGLAATPLAVAGRIIAMHPTERMCVVINTDIQIIRWDASGVATIVGTVGASMGATLAARFHPSGNALVVGSELNPRLFFFGYKGGVFTQYTPTGALPSYFCTAIDFTADGTMMVVASRDADRVHVYDVLPRPDDFFAWLGDTPVDAAYHGSDGIDAIYVGNTKVL